MSQRCHWYHCTVCNHGQTWVAERRAPIMRAADEPLTPRLCVCPSPAECFSAILFPTHRDVYVYRTSNERRAVAPRGVWDKIITGERWLIPPVEMQLFCAIPASVVADCQTAIRLYHEETRNRSDIRTRIAQLALSAAIFRRQYRHLASRSLSRFCDSLCSSFDIGKDPEEYILSRAEGIHHA